MLTHLKPNYLIINAVITVYAVKFILMLLLSILFSISDDETYMDDTNSYKCRVTIAFGAFYVVAWVADMSTISLTSFINVRLSSKKHQAHNEFLMVFSNE